jgi:hypothetical protein
MTSDYGTYDDPFEGVDRKARLAIQRQITDLTERRYRPAVRHAILKAIQRGREGRDELVPFDFLPREVGADILLARGDIVLTQQSFRQDGARAILDAFGLLEQEPTGCAELDEIVVRTQNAELDASTLDNVAQMLRSRGFAASVHHLFPLAPDGQGNGGLIGPVGKGISSAEHAPPLPDFAPRGNVQRPVRVSVIDTGIAAEERTDGWLRRDAVPRTDDNIDPLYDPADSRTLAISGGHGTFVAGIVQQVAPGAEIRASRTLDIHGVATDLQVATAMINAVKDDECEILNLSLGGSTADNAPPVAITAALDVIHALGQARGTEVVIVAAAGNGGDDTPYFPAACPGVVAVAGLKADLTPAAWSTRGFWVAFSTIGEGVRSTFVEGVESAFVDPDPDTYGPNAWAFWCGSSFAAPQISGRIAQLSYENGISAQQALALLQNEGQRLPLFGRTIKILPGL